MKNHKTLSLTLGLLLGILAMPALSHAEIVVDPGFEGSLVITSPDGTSAIFNAGDAIPTIVTGSTITVMGGEAKISTTVEGEKVNCKCLGADFGLPGASSVKLTCGTKAGNLEVTKGEASVTAVSGDAKNLKTGDQYPITAEDSALPADPTAAGESLGITPSGDSEPNSRDMAVSPGQ